MSTTLTDELKKEISATSSMASTDAPQHCLHIEPNIHSTIWGRFIEPYLSGANPVCHSANLPPGLDMEETFALIPVDLVSREYRSTTQCLALIETSDFAALVHRNSYNNGSITVRATTAEAAQQGLQEVAAWFPAPEAPATAVSVDFWQSNQGMFTTSRSIDASDWADVAHHYPGETGGALDDLMGLELGDPNGRVILWHGPPGTGKTSAIRTLARSWREQADFQVVLDPEPVFAQSANLMQVILNSHDDENSLWRVLVIEDADEIVRADNATTSQSLSRLLNVGDGIVGQGLKVLVLLTTNEPPSRLHPALTRPGRCLANTEFRKFTPSEAAQAFPGLASATSTRDDRSLAEILTGRVEEPDEQGSHGRYL